jgi:hypothetical protein
MIALGVAARFLHDTVAYADVADAILTQLAKARGFPPSLSFAAVEKAMSAPKAEDISPQMLALLERSMAHTFLEVNPHRTSSAFRKKIGAALDLLARSSAPVGRKTYEAIATGGVRVDSLADLNRADYARVRRDFAKEGTHIADMNDARALRAITASMAGYMWDDRIYVAENMPAADIARALVHEVNHVLNESEEHYRGAKQTLVEEYRAFYAESLFVGDKMTPRACRELKERVIADYLLKGVTPDDVPDVPPGILG